VPKSVLRRRRRIGSTTEETPLSDPLPVEQVARSRRRASTSASEKRRRGLRTEPEGPSAEPVRVLVDPGALATEVAGDGSGIDESAAVRSDFLHGLR
jgi:hypothetical protein